MDISIRMVLVVLLQREIYTLKKEISMIKDVDTPLFFESNEDLREDYIIERTERINFLNKLIVKIRSEISYGLELEKQERDEFQHGADIMDSQVESVIKEEDDKEDDPFFNGGDIQISLN